MAIKGAKFFYKVLALIVLTGFGLSLIHSGYHDSIDVLGAGFFGALLLGLYGLFQNNRALPWIVLLLMKGLMVYIHFVYRLESHLWLAYYGFIGLALLHRLFVKQADDRSILSKSLLTLICFTLMGGVFLLFNRASLRVQPSVLYELQWLLIGFSLPLSISLLPSSKAS